MIDNGRGEVGESKRSGRWGKRWVCAAQCRGLFRLYRRAKWVEEEETRRGQKEN